VTRPSFRQLGQLLENAARDVAFGIRVLRRSAGSTAVAVGILAVGIGANTTIFRFVSALLLQPPPVDAPKRLVQIWNLNVRASSAMERYVPLTYPDYAYYRDQSRTLSGVIGYDGDPTTVSWMRGGHGEMAQAQYVSDNFFDVLGVKAVVGRLGFVVDNGSGGGTPAVVISHRFWSARLGSERSVVGSTINLNGVTFIVSGVTPSAFTGLLAGLVPDVWVPLSSTEAVRHERGLLASRSTYWLLAVGRLNAGATEDNAKTELALLNRQRIAADRGVAPAPNGEQPSHYDVAVFPETMMPAPLRLPVMAFVTLLQVVVLMVLLIACANAANLFLAQAAARRPEMVLRWVLGASRARLVQLVLAQTLLVSVIAGIAGYFVAHEAAPLMLQLIPPMLPLRLELSLDWRVIAFGVALALFAGVVFGLAPALRTTRELSASLGRSVAGGRRASRLRNALVTTQVAVSLVLLVGGALCWQSLMRAQSADPGFRVADRVVAQIDLQGLGYRESAGRVLQRRLLDRVASLPRVRHASSTGYLPLMTSRSVIGVRIPGVTAPAGDDAIHVQSFDVGPNFFVTMGTPVLHGREFAVGDDDRAPRVAIVNEAMAKRYWGGGSAVGRVVSIDTGGGTAPYEVIGVVATGKYRSLNESPAPVLFRAERQAYHPRLTVVAEVVPGASEAALGDIRKEVAALDPNLVVITGTMKQSLGFTLFPARAAGLALSVAGVLGLLLALAGIAAVLAQSVAQRTREIGIRMALGAQPREILTQVVGEGARLIGVGLGIGAVAALAVTRVLSGLLYGISPNDPGTFAAVILLLTGSALGACLLVARRAVAVDPVAAMR
jgi:predicted permease